MRPLLRSPVFVPPMLPALVEEPPAGRQWIHEIKHDGYRTVLLVDGGKARAFTRQKNDWTWAYPTIVAAAGKLKCRSAIIDGEAIVQDEEGRSDFHAVKLEIGHGGKRLVFFAFDLAFLDGRDLRGVPIEERRGLLRKLIPQSARSPLQFSDHVEGGGPEFYAAAERMGLEGIVSKRVGSLYRSGRTDRWLKTKCYTTGAFVLLGTEKKTGPAAAPLAQEVDGELVFAGKAMITLTAADRERLSADLERLSARKPAIAALRGSSVRWVKPELVVGVRHLRGSGGLRHATVRSIEDR